MKDPLNWLLGLVILACIAMPLYIFGQIHADSKRHELPFTDKDVYIGVVTQVSGCSKSKYSTNCWVRFNNGPALYTDISDWPGDNLTVGQEVWRRVRTQGDRQELYYVVKGQKFMRYMGSCDVEDNCWEK